MSKELTDNEVNKVIAEFMFDEVLYDDTARAEYRKIDEEFKNDSTK